MIDASPARCLTVHPGLVAKHATVRWALPVAPLVLALLVLVVLIGLPLAGLRYDGRDGLDVAICGVAMLWCLGYGTDRLAGGACIGAAFRAFALFLALNLATMLASAILAVGTHPFIDGRLAAADRLLLPGFDWRATMLALGERPALLTILSHVYGSLTWQPSILFVMMGLGRPVRRSEPFLCAWAIAVGVCLAGFHWLPARSAYPYFAISAAQMPGLLSPVSWDCPLILDGLRSGAIDRVDIHSIVGLVTMPSFHAAAAVLLAWAFWPSRLRLPMVALNALMVASAIPIGGRYVVDVVAGVLVALAAIGIADRLDRWHRRR